MKLLKLFHYTKHLFTENYKKILIDEMDVINPNQLNQNMKLLYQLKPKNIKLTSELKEEIIEIIHKNLSPEQISGVLKKK